MQDIISLLDRKENISNEISRLQRAQQTISEQVKDYVKNLSSEKKRFLDDKILSTFNEDKLKQIESYRNYMKNLSTGLCNSYQSWNIFDPYTDKYTIEKYKQVIYDRTRRKKQWNKTDNLVLFMFCRNRGIRTDGVDFIYVLAYHLYIS